MVDLDNRTERMAEGRIGSLWNRRGRPRLWVVALSAFLIFTLAGLFFATELFIGLSSAEMVRPFPWYLIWTLSTAWSWLAVFPLISWCTRRWPFEKGRIVNAAAGHLGVFLLVAPLQVTMDTCLSLLEYTLLFPKEYALDYHASLFELLRGMDRSFLAGLAGAPVPFAVIAGLLHGARFYKKYQERELEASRLENALNLARLQSLQSQLNPHFLFNTLNAIGALSRRDPESTNRMVTMLSGLLRRSLDTSDRQTVTLREEVELARDYLDIEKVRFPDRLNAVFDVPSDLLALRVPSLVLQPLAENAVRYAIAPRSTPGQVAIRARVRDGNLELVVEDDGDESAGGDGMGRGRGLKITRERLGVLYAGGASLDLSRRPEGGTRATITIPVALCLPPMDEEASP